MTKLTATEFGELSVQQAYSVYDDAMGACIEARRAQADALADHETTQVKIAALTTDLAAANALLVGLEDA